MSPFGMEECRLTKTGMVPVFFRATRSAAIDFPIPGTDRMRPSSMMVDKGSSKLSTVRAALSNAMALKSFSPAIRISVATSSSAWAADLFENIKRREVTRGENKSKSKSKSKSKNKSEVLVW